VLWDVVLCIWIDGINILGEPAAAMSTKNMEAKPTTLHSITSQKTTVLTLTSFNMEDTLLLQVVLLSYEVHAWQYVESAHAKHTLFLICATPLFQTPNFHKIWPLHKKKWLYMPHH
jgi:hypothetical protein